MGWLILGLLLYFIITVAERALVRVTPQEMDVMRNNDNTPAAQRSLDILRQIRPSMAALLLARLLLKVGIATGIAAWFIQSHFLKTFLYDLSIQSGLPGWLLWGASGILLALALAAVFRLVQRIDILSDSPGSTARMLIRLSGFIRFWHFLFKPLIKVEYSEKTAVQSGNNNHTTPESAQNPEVTSEKRELELLKSIVKFGDVTIKQVMQPRSKVVAVDFRTDFHELLSTVRETEFSRLPVYDEDLDNITGILYVKDLLPHLEKDADFEWQALIRTNVLLVPESKRGIELLQEFKQQKLHMAIVVDEYGGSSGIVTLEDILEEVTGDIRDEFDEESEIRFRKIDDFNYLFEGQTLLNDVCRITGIASDTFDDARGAADTLAGLVLELRGDIPKAGAEIKWNNYQIIVTAANSRRIEQLKLSLPRS